MSQTIGMIGVGHMASAIARGIRASREDVSILLNTLEPSLIEELAKEIDATILSDDRAYPTIVESSDLIFLGVKPGDVNGLMEELAPLLSEEEPKTWVSMAAGVTLEKLQALAPKSHRWIRIMPNTPIEIGEGYCAYCYNKNVRELDIDLLKSILDKACIVSEIAEAQFDAVTGLPGSGPAFVYMFIDALSDAGVLHGLKREDALKMAASVVRGAATMVIEGNGHPGVLKDQITSPGGTTIEGVVEMEKAGFRQAVIRGVDAAINKSKSMSQNK